MVNLWYVTCNVATKVELLYLCACRRKSKKATASASVKSSMYKKGDRDSRRRYEDFLVHHVRIALIAPHLSRVASTLAGPWLQLEILTL